MSDTYTLEITEVAETYSVDVKTDASGLSAYQLAVLYDGFSGSLQDYLDSLKGEKGDTGDQGPQGPAGTNGSNGATGATGATGSPGPGVSAGGAADEVLYKINATDYNTAWKKVIDFVLTGLSLATGGVIAATDTVLQAFGKIQKQITDLVNSGVEAPYTGTITWTAGAAPSGASNLRQFYTKVGNLVNFEISIVFGSGGTSVTNVSLTFPSEFPVPIIPTGFTGADVLLYPVNARIIINKTSGVSALGTMCIRRNSSDNGFVISQIAAVSAQRYSIVIISGSYFTA